MRRQKSFYPDWYEGIPSPTSYRAILKWGGVDRFKHPNRRLYRLIKETFGMTDEDFTIPYDMGLEEVSPQVPPTLTSENLDAFRRIAGEENVRTDTFSRLRATYGKTTYDTFRLREGTVENLPGAVISPRDKTDIAAIVRYCDAERIPVYVFGGGSSVTRGFECVRGGIALDMATHMKRILRLNEENHTVTVEPGIFGPDLEDALNSAPQGFGAQRAYTCGHFPQSFEHSSVGGWVVTRGAGQNSTYYGKIEDLVVCQEYVTPVGVIRTGEYPASATGPSIDQIMIGSEGAYGVLVAVTLKVFRYNPSHTRRFSFIFRGWDDAVDATREVLQGEIGRPSVFRLSDPEETDIAMKLYGVEGTLFDTLLKVRGYRPGERCLLLGTADGSGEFTRLVRRSVRRICRRYGAMYGTGFAARRWEEGRFSDPYMREDLQDFGIIIDTLECAASWEQLRGVHARVREYCTGRPRTICMSHCSHFYPQGANLYFIFIGRMEREEFVEYHRGVLDAIQGSGAAISHHHGIGKLFAPWLEGQIGKNQIEVFRALKRHFDPHNIMNPGGTLALDLPDFEKRGTGQG